jgi:hypothetical protein
VRWRITGREIWDFRPAINTLAEARVDVTQGSPAAERSLLAEGAAVTPRRCVGARGPHRVGSSPPGTRKTFKSRHAKSCLV